MRIAILVEGKTESAFKQKLIEFLKSKLEGSMPKLDFVQCDGALPTKGKLNRTVMRLLGDKRNPANAVIALTDVYPGFENAQDAKAKIAKDVENQDQFFVHVALHDFEAWLLPYWEEIQKLTGSSRSSPGAKPEKINHHNSPAYRLAEVYRLGNKSKKYKKTIDAGKILRGEDLMVAINACPELKAFVNRILSLCGVADEELIP